MDISCYRTIIGNTITDRKEAVMEFKVGSEVKIADIGPLATCLEIKNNRLKLDLNGEKFWINKELCDSILNQME